MTRKQWARQLLERLGITPTTANVTALIAWAQAEGGHWNNTAHYNPLNTTQSAPGATSMNSVGVKSYTSWNEGFDATVETLQNGHYTAIVNALKNGSAKDVVNAVVSSVWGTKTISLAGVKVTGKGGSGDTSSSGGGGGGGLLSWPSEIVTFFRGTTDAITSTTEFFAAFARPSTYIRIGAGWFGLMFLIAGIIALGMSAAKEK